MNYKLILFDRIEKIKAINEQYDLLNNSYISFSGGKDSTILHYVIDMALPNNNIPRVYANTGLEYIDMVKFVKNLAEKDNRFVILNQTRNIKETLDKYGYPFKSKEFSMRVYLFNKGSNAPFIKRYLDINNKTYACPDIVRYIFNERGQFNISNFCCSKLKKDLLKHWQKENHKTISITGMRNEEGGQREHLGCLTNNNTMFHPLIVVDEQWEDEFIKTENIELCKLYYPPFNFKRTGCKGCPYNIFLQQDLDTMAKYLPAEKKQCELIWKPIYDEYRRIGYRLRKNGVLEQIKWDI